MELFDKSLTIMEKSLDLRMANQRVVSANLANINTPGFKAQKLDFEASMENAIQMVDLANGAPTPTATPIITESTDPAITLDGNNVDLETEMGQLSRNKMMYSLTSQIMAAKMRQLATVISSER